MKPILKERRTLKERLGLVYMYKTNKAGQNKTGSQMKGEGNEQ